VQTMWRFRRSLCSQQPSKAVRLLAGHDAMKSMALMLGHDWYYVCMYEIHDGDAIAKVTILCNESVTEALFMLVCYLLYVMTQDSCSSSRTSATWDPEELCQAG